MGPHFASNLSRGEVVWWRSTASEAKFRRRRCSRRERVARNVSIMCKRLGAWCGGRGSVHLEGWWVKAGYVHTLCGNRTDSREQLLLDRGIERSGDHFCLDFRVQWCLSQFI